jgi:nucleoside-diphosphate-sugar epimerase
MPNRKKSKVFITGAGGFIGANIVRLLLKKNFDIHILKKQKQLSWRLQDIDQSLTIHPGDITHFSSLKAILHSIKPDYIIHLAAYGAYHYQDDLQKIVKVNIQGTKNLLEASKGIPYQCFINTGSSSEYGYKNKPMKESDLCDPVSYYAATKLAQTHLCKVFAKLNNKPILTFRLFSVYGPYEEPRRFIPTIINAVISDKPIQLTPGKQRRDFIYVDDVANAYIRAFTNDKIYNGEIFNIGTGNEFTNDEIVTKLFSVTGKKTTVEKGAYPKRSWDTSHWVANISKTTKALAWKPENSLENGIKKTYNWLEENISYYK